MIPFPFALRAGLVPGVIAAVLLAFGTLGFNGIVYVIAGEVAGRSAGVAVGAASTVVFLIGSITPPRVRAAGREERVRRDVRGAGRCSAWPVR